MKKKRRKIIEREEGKDKSIEQQCILFVFISLYLSPRDKRTRHRPFILKFSKSKTPQITNKHPLSLSLSLSHSLLSLAFIINSSSCFHLSCQILLVTTPIRRKKREEVDDGGKQYCKSMSHTKIVCT